MAVITYEAVIEHGQVRLPPDIVLPESQKVFVVVPNVMPMASKLPTVRLANPADAEKFQLSVTWGDEN